MARRAELVKELEPWLTDDIDGHPWGAWASFAREDAPDRMPGATSRWNAGKDLSWIALRPERVIEVAYDHMEGTRFRHTAQWRRWRDDRDPLSCTYEQLDRPVTFDLTSGLAGRPSQGVPRDHDPGAHRTAPAPARRRASGVVLRHGHC